MSQTDAISGETVAYQYDTLGRLTRAESTGPQWGLAWTYDGFGNRLTQSVVKGSGPAASTPVYPATNRLQDASIDYDAAGNVTRFSMPDSSQRWLTWDALNRMTAAWTGSPHPGGHTEVYTYDASNQRVMKQRDQDQPVLTYYGIDGKPMGDYTVNWDTTQVWFTGGGWSASVGFFGLENPNRLQSKGDHYPYGEQKGVYTPSFATYTRESFTNLDYAINRYYSAPTGRFISPDPYQASGGAADPGSWNRYGYVEGDPVNYVDTRGLFVEPVGPTLTPYFPFDPSYPGQPATPGGERRGTEEEVPIGSDPVDVGSIYSTVANAVFWAAEELYDPDCAGMFLAREANTLANRKTLAGTLTTLWDFDVNKSTIRLYEATADIKPGVLAQTVGHIYEPGVAMQLFTNRGFFSGLDASGRPLSEHAEFSGMDIFTIQRAVLVHEFLHFMGIVGEDSERQIYTLPNGQVTGPGSAGISDTVKRNCFQ